MPLRTVVYGKVPPATAALYSTNVANEAAAGLWPTPFEEGVFCGKFKSAMLVQFNTQYPNLGASMLP